MGRRNATLQGAARHLHPHLARRAGVVVAGLVVVAGTTTLFDASSSVFGTAPPTETLTCNDNWTGAGPSGDWNSAANWTTGVPDGTGVNACIAGNAAVTLSDASFSVNELTLSAGSSLTIGAGDPAGAATSPTTAPAAASLSVSSGLQNDGSLTVLAAGTTGHPALALDGPITNTGTFTIDGTVGIGDASSTAVSNDGTLAIAPGGQVTVDGNSTITNEPEGLLAFGIDGPPSSDTSSGRISGGTLALGGTAAPVFENGFSPSSGAEYVVDAGASTGTFASVVHGTMDSSHAGEIGLIGGAPATTPETRVTSSLPTGSLLGHRVQLTAVVAPASGTNPTGSVSFSAGDVALGSSPVTTSAAGVTSATVDVSTLPVGYAPITVTYAGDVLFGASTSPVLTQVVNPDPTTLTLTPSMPSPEAGQPVTDTATVARADPSPGIPAGTVTFTDDGSPVPGCQSLRLADVAPLQASCTETFGSGATHAIVASYSGDVDDAASTASLLQTVGQIPTVTTVTSSTPNTVYGQAAVVTATIAPAANAPLSPTGNVTFSDGSMPLATVEVSTAGGVATARLDTSGLVEGPHFVTVIYSGDPTFAASTPATPVTVTVAPVPTAVTVGSSFVQSVVGQTVVFTAAISSPAAGATGTVQFADDGDMIGSGAVSGGRATFETSSLALGDHPITALYEGDDNFIGVSSTNTIAQSVGQAATATSVTSANQPGLVGQPVASTATVAVTAPGSGSPTGTVSFSDGGTPIPACQGLTLPPAPPLAVTCTQAYDSVGAQSITASYGGDANFTISAGVMVENVSPMTTTTTLVPSPPASTSGQSVSLTATVAPTWGTADPDGTVTFSLNGTSLGSSIVSTTDGVSSASMLLTTLPLGVDSVTAAYGGSADFLASASVDGPSVTVTKAATTVGLDASANPSTPGQPMTLTATVFPVTGFGEGGAVTFLDNGLPIGTSPVRNGQATLTVFATLADDDPLTADYSGDANFSGSSTTTPLLPPG